MTFQIHPLAAKVNNINGTSNASNVGRAKVLYIMGTAADTITNKTTGASFQISAGQSIIMFKQDTDEVFSGVTTTHFTKINYPRG
tara:strand:+ start:290 stop:544 length:255 start_codon:yes stop_codon:yes gene_type:complete